MAKPLLLVLFVTLTGCQPPDPPYHAATNVRLFHECLRAANAGASEEADEVVQECKWAARRQAQELYAQRTPTPNPEGE